MEPAAPIEVVAVDAGRWLDDLKFLMTEYARLPHVDGRWSGADAEIATLPLGFEPPRGALLLARIGERSMGCVGLKAAHEASTVELKRMYVRPAARRLGLGRALLDAAIARARASGHSSLRLDTLPQLDAALALYLAVGFRPIPAYDPVLPPEARCYALRLHPALGR
jgi:GNAT superfamily N-acetyltransferase